MKLLPLILLAAGFVLIGVSFLMPHAAQRIDEQQLEEYDEIVYAVHKARSEGTDEGREKAKQDRERARAISEQWETDRQQRSRLISFVRIAGLILAVIGGGIHVATREG